jgi:hypothetical protein
MRCNHPEKETPMDEWTFKPPFFEGAMREQPGKVEITHTTIDHGGSRMESAPYLSFDTVEEAIRHLRQLAGGANGVATLHRWDGTRTMWRL